MTDNNKRILLFTVILSTLAIFGWIAYKNCGNDFEKQTQIIQAKKATADTAKTSTDASISQYNSKKDKNITAEKQVAKKAVLECDSQDDATILLDFAELIERAKEYNTQHREE